MGLVTSVFKIRLNNCVNSATRKVGEGEGQDDINISS